MILLEAGNRILLETLTAQLLPNDNDFLTDTTTTTDSTDPNPTLNNVRQPIDIRLCDYDDTTYRVSITDEKLSTLNFSMNAPYFNAISSYALPYLKEVYGEYVKNASETEPNFDVTLQIPLSSTPNNSTYNLEFVTKLSCLRYHTLSSIFLNYFNFLLSPSSVPSPLSPYSFALRDDTKLYFIPKADRVVVVFALQFSDFTEIAIAKIFMAELIDAKRKLQAAPPMNFSVNPPLEMKDFGGEFANISNTPANNNSNSASNELGWVTFSLLKNHIEDKKRHEKIITNLILFRNYIHYHIKCSKSYFHSRMRARVVNLLKVLARAKIEEKKEMKTVSGKTFVRN
jgi:actin related protein 2/3 complex subunit 2